MSINTVQLMRQQSWMHHIVQHAIPCQASFQISGSSNAAPTACKSEAPPVESTAALICSSWTVLISAGLANGPVLFADTLY